MNTNKKGNLALGKAISYFTENDYKFYLNEIEDGELTFQNAIIEKCKLYNRLYLYY